jgi:serine/threonine protein kinase
MRGGFIVDWPSRFRIIEGVAQGAVYLHHHSRLRIIHRDLKPSNILLDSDMNPKIPNFDLAKVLSPGMIQDTAACVVGSVHDPSFLHYNIMNFIYFHLEEHISIQDCKKK